MLVGILVVGCAPSVLTSQLGPDPAGDFVAMTNRDRAANGVQRLAVEPILTNLAQRWAEHLAATGVWTHQDLEQVLQGAARGFHWVAENIGTIPIGATEEALEDLFLNDDGHSANLLRPGDNVIGVGVATDKDGTAWVVVDFGEEP